MPRWRSQLNQNSQKFMQALVIGNSVHLILALPDMLKQAGFEIDCLSNRRILKSIPSLRHFFQIRAPERLPEMAATVIRDNPYDLVIVADDGSLHAILCSSLSDEDKLALLPVTAVSDFSHLCSKIGLSLRLQQHALSTPAFLIVQDKQALQQASEKMAFPFMLKGDFSSGGRQTYECASQSDLFALLKHFHAYPALVQKKITGEEIGVEAFYQKGVLIHFAYSRIIKTENNRKFAPSKLREYTQAGALDAAVVEELRKLGVALGADGYVNITCLISQADQKRYYIEADMRPTTWINFPRYLGDPPAQKIKNYFANGQLSGAPERCNPDYPEKMILPYFLRMKLWELLSNRYQVWRYMQWDLVTLHTLFKKMVRPLVAIFNMRTYRGKLKTGT